MTQYAVRALIEVHILPTWLEERTRKGEDPENIIREAVQEQFQRSPAQIAIDPVDLRLRALEIREGRN